MAPASSVQVEIVGTKGLYQSQSPLRLGWRSDRRFRTLCPSMTHSSSGAHVGYIVWPRIVCSRKILVCPLNIWCVRRWQSLNGFICENANVNSMINDQLLVVFVVWVICCCALLSRTRSPGRNWAVIRLFHRPELSGHVVYGEVYGLDIGGQHGQWFVLLRHTHSPQRKPYPICTSRSRNVGHPGPD